MATNAYLNMTQRVSATFYSWNDDGDAEPEAPATVEVRIYNTATVPDTLITTDVPELDDTPGSYFYLWTPDTLGHYNVQFFGTFPDESTALGNNFFEVFEEEPVSEPGKTLGSDEEIVFTGAVTPLYIDPDDLFIFFNEIEVSNADIVEAIYNASVVAEPYLVNGRVTELVREYVEAAAMCSLSRIYDQSGNFGMGGGNEEAVTLGDLTVRSSDSSSSRGNSPINRGNAATWCELAMVLRRELTRAKNGMQATQKAGHRSSRHSTREFARRSL